MTSVVDWRQLLTQHGVRFVERGPNVKRGELNIQCPFCGTADPSHHMGLNLETGWWACWRNSTHRGKSPVRLVAQLLNLPYWKARKLLGLDSQDPDPDGFDAVAARVLGREAAVRPEHARREFLRAPPEFKDFTDAPMRFYDYLQHTRGFGLEGCVHAIHLYNLRFAVRGDYRERIILPYYMDGSLVAWTARAITQAVVRYRDLEEDACLVSPKKTLFNLDCRMDGGRALALVEGPIDALKLDVFGRAYGLRAVALSTNSISEEQIHLLAESATEFAQVIVMLDTATPLGVVDSMRMRSELMMIPNVRITPTPYGRKDAAEMTPAEIRSWAQEVTQ